VTRTSDFVSKLIKAANAVEQQTDADKKSLLDNAVNVIQHLRNRLGYRFDNTMESLFHLRSVSSAVAVDWASDQQIRLALLEAARMIRDLSIELGSEESQAGNPVQSDPVSGPSLHDQKDG
jgi:ribosomal protein L1